MMVKAPIFPPQFPPPDASREEVERWTHHQAECAKVRRGFAIGVQHRCYLCGGRGHVPGQGLRCKVEVTATRAEVVTALAGKP